MSHKRRGWRLAVVWLGGLMLAGAAPSGYAARRTAVDAARATSFEIDGVQLTLQTPFLPSAVVTSSPGDFLQMATASATHPSRGLTLTAVPYDAGAAEPLPRADLGGAAAQDALAAAEGLGSLRSARRLSLNEGWAITDSALLVTSDAGVTWQDRSPHGWAQGPDDVLFLGDGRVVAAAVAPRSNRRLAVALSPDNGVSWETRVVEESAQTGWARYRSASVYQAGSALYLVGREASTANWSRGQLLRSQDGGHTWTRLPAPPGAGAMAFASASVGFMVAAPANDGLFVTRDGGGSWQRVELPVAGTKRAPHMVLAAPSFRNAREGRLLGTVPGENARVVLFETRDAGASWIASWERSVVDDGSLRPRPAALRVDGELAALATAEGVAFGEAHAAERSLSEGGLPASVEALTFADDEHGWALVGEGGCDATHCRQSTRLVVLDGQGAVLLRRMLVEARPQSETLATAPTPEGSTISNSLGFDTCSAPATSTMSAWKSFSPFADANIYYGGAARACAQPNLSASWVSTVFSQGWRLIPTWVGPQAPCTGYATRFSSTSSTAYNEGVAQANLAVDAAAALGLGSGSPLYYDLELYEPSTSCSPAVRSFVSGWSAQGRARGYLAGLYAHSRDIGTDLLPSQVSAAPDAIWAAEWGTCGGGTPSCPTPTNLDLYYVPGTAYNNHQRIRQYWGDHNETYGGVLLGIDRDIADGPVAVAGSSSIDGSTFVGEGPPLDGTQMAPSTTFTKRWTLRNSGTSTWTTTGYRARRVSGAYGPATLALGGNVAPGANVDITGTFTAPSTAGTYRATYQMEGSKGLFGTTFWVEIVVTSSGGSFSGLSATLGCAATFNFTANGVAGPYVIDLGILPDMSSGVYLSFGTGSGSPITVTDPAKWDKYTHGRTLYWRVWNNARTVSSSIQTAVVNCPSIGFTGLSANLGCTSTFSFTATGVPGPFIVDLGITADMSSGVYLSFGSGGSGQVWVTNPNKWDQYTNGRRLYWRVWNSARTVSSPIQTAVVACNTTAFSSVSATLGCTSTFGFSVSGVAGPYIVDMSTTADMSSGVYLTFGSGSASPVTVTNPSKWDQYTSGRTLYWRVLNSTRTAAGPIQAATVSCAGGFSGLSATLGCASTFNFTANGVAGPYVVDLGITPDMSSGVYLTFGSGASSPISVTDPKKWDQYTYGRPLYWRVWNSARTVTSAIQSATVSCP